MYLHTYTQHIHIYTCTYIQHTLFFETLIIWKNGGRKRGRLDKYVLLAKGGREKRKGGRERYSSLLTVSLPFSHWRNKIERDKVYLYLWPSSPSSTEAAAALGVLSNTLLLRIEVALRDQLIIPLIFSACVWSFLSLMTLLDQSSR